MQSTQAKQDVLTDSESDDEQGYTTAKPSIEKARSIVKPSVQELEAAAAAVAAPIAGKGAAGKTAVPVAPAVTATTPTPHSIGGGGAGEAFGRLSAGQRREEQVELLRDRKTLDMETVMSQMRKDRMDAVAKRLTRLFIFFLFLFSSSTFLLPSLSFFSFFV